jgi:hypothetical protein
MSNQRSTRDTMSLEEATISNMGKIEKVRKLVGGCS